MQRWNSPPDGVMGCSSISTFKTNWESLLKAAKLADLELSDVELITFF